MQALEGKLNINGVFYASRMQQGQETLLDARRNGNGVWQEYQAFQNYTMTYLDPEHDDIWRIRFRKNPGGKIIAERHKKHVVKPGQYQRMTYIFEKNGRMRLYVDGVHMQQYRDKEDVYREGYHALRSFKTHSKYRNFRVYRILPGGQK